MNIEELKKKLEDLKVPQNYYQINGHLSTDTYMLNHIFNFWEYFYFDERGNQNGYRRFDNENDACIYFYKILQNEMRYWKDVKGEGGTERK